MMRLTSPALLLALVVGAAPAAGAQGAPAAAAPAIPAALAADSLTTRFEVSGVTVILRRNTSNQVVAASLYLLGGTRNETAANAGIEPFYLWSSERGTQHYSRDALRAKTAALGSTIVVEPRDDWTMFGFRGVRATFDSTWALWADRLMNPTLDSAQVEQVRTQVLTAVRQRTDSPDDLVQYLADSVAYVGHPYALAAAGTERSLAAITVADLRRWRESQLVTSRMLLVVVGDVDRATLERLVAGTIGRLPRGNYRWTPPPDVGSRRASAVIIPRQLPTNYILGYYTGPRADDRDYQALRIAAAVLGARLFTEVRSRRNLTYAVEAPFIERAISAGGLYVTTVAPDSVLDIMRREIAALQRQPVDAENLHVIVQQFITEYFLNNETNAEQANFLARAELYRGDYRAASRFVDELRSVTPDDVRAAARRYMRDVRFAYVGDPTRVDPRLLGSF